jgi:hypothetical protein
MTDITYESALEALRAVVAEKVEGYVYPKVDGECLYSHNGKPSCGVGYVLHRLGVDVKALENTTSNTDRFDRVANKLRDLSVITITQSAIDLLQDFQDRQDWGLTWSEALSGAIKYAEGRMEDRADRPLRPIV